MGSRTRADGLADSGAPPWSLTSSPRGFAFSGSSVWRSPTGAGGRAGMAETERRRSHDRRKTQAGAAAEPDGGLGEADLGVFRRGRGARGVPAPAIVEKETEGRSGLTRSVRRTP